MAPVFKSEWHLPPARELLGPALWAASRDNKLSEVKRLVQKRPYPLQYVWTPLLLPAVEGSALAVVAYCLEQGARITDRTLSTISYSKDSDAAYRYLVGEGILDVNYDIDRTGTLLGTMTSSKRYELVRFMLDRGADPNQRVECYCHIKALAAAAQSGDPEMIGILLDHGAKLKGSGALVLAAERGKLEAVRFLLARGADFNELAVVLPDRRSLTCLGTPLHKAVEKGHIHIIEELLSAGAEVNVQDAEGRTALDIAKEKDLDEDVLTRLAVQV